jgi:hypothetical protein
MKKTSFSLIEDILFYFILLLFMLAYLIPANPGMPGSGLDPSWSNTINYAFINNLQFGKEVIFTYGPLGSFRFPYYVYAESSYYPALILSVFIAFVVASSLFVFSRNKFFLTKILGLIAVIAGLQNNGLFFWYLIPILFAAITLEKHKILSAFLLIIMSFSVLVKFSHFPIAILTVFFVDGYFFYKSKRLTPWYTLLFFIFMIFIFVLSGQNLFNFYDYFMGSFNTLSGYSEAMNTFGPKSMIYVFLILFFSMFFLLLKVFFAHKNIKLFIFSLIASIVLFMAFKQGFVRHDAHATAAFAGMAYVYGLLLLRYSSYLIKSVKQYLVSVILVGLAIISTYSVSGYYAKQPFYKIINHDFNSIKNNLIEMPHIFNPERKIKLNQIYSKSMEKIKNQLDLSVIEGDVDIYPWDQSFVIANDLDFAPRPLFQSYSVYTPKLIEKNIEFLKSKRAPENILFTIKEIDGRLPLMMEGASWLEIFSRYDVVEKKGEFLHLKTVGNPLPYSLKFLHSIDAKFDQSIDVPENNVFVKINIQKSIFGKIINTLFKPPVLHIELNFHDGSHLIKRIIPNIASNGFILSPYIEDIYDFYMYDLGKTTGKKVNSFKIINGSYNCYKKKIQVEFSSIAMDQKNRNITIPTEFKYLMFMKDIENKSNNYSHINVQTYENENVLFSHVGTSFQGLSDKIISDSLKVKFGFFKSSYTGNNQTDGGCFNVYRENKNNLVYNKCLNPREVKLDQNEHSFILDIEEKMDNYIFEIVPRPGKSNAWGWSYWKFEDVNELK